MQRVGWLVGLALLLVAFDYPPAICYKNCSPIVSPAPLTQINPALDWSVVETGTELDPLAAFGRRPIDEPRLIPQGGNYQDPARDGPHYGIDYTFPELFLHDIPQPIYPIGPGIVTALHPCATCWAGNAEKWGRLRTGSIEAVNNFGFGAVVMIEHPYNADVSFYSFYAHLREIQVSLGQRVDSETVLALLGASGDTAAPHVHMEIRVGPPGAFWGANFSDYETVSRWARSYVETPLFLLYAEHHVPFTKVLERWVLEQAPLQADN